MKLKEGFITHKVEDEQIMVASGNASFSGIVRSNGTAAFIIECLKTDTDAEKIADMMCEKYDVSRETVLRDINSVIDKLKEIGAVE